MVMEAPPSPQSVGREFVRQYYTLLNKAPTHLHRFYNHQSSFVHGGLDPPNRETSPVIGQKQIHQKIQQLNFRDCHAKITQVDSQATLGNGVVVQVTGELSNAGQPMRRFTQTFVLAAQSPKKYYVHNDIFRYQDEIVSDEECDADTRSEGEDDVTMERQVLSDIQQPITQSAIPPYYNPNAAQIAPNIGQVPIHHNQQPPQHIMAQQPVATVNGAIHPEDISVLPGQVPTHVAPAPTQGLVAPMPDMQQGLVQAPMNVNVADPIEDPEPEDIVEDQPENVYSDEQQDIEPENEIPVESEFLPASNEPKTYANLLKSGNNAPPFGSPPQSTAPLQQQMIQPVCSTSPPINTMSNQAGTGSRQSINSLGGSNRGQTGGPRISQGQQQQTRMPNRQDSNRGSMGSRNLGNEDGSFDDRRRFQNQNNDVNQLFLGNLPHTATEDELREIFSEFGSIVDLRIHSKTTNKVGGPPGQRAPPNFGFITYDNQQGVQNCLQARPIYYPKDDKNGTSLNVEEKKTKDRPAYGGGRPTTDNNRGGRGGDNAGQRRMGGPGGPNRNGGGPGGPPGPNNRTNTYNRNNGPPNNRGSNTYNRR